MKKVLFATAAILCALAITVSAAEGKKKSHMTDEQKAIHKEMLDKYDANKDGKLDKEERAKMSKEDKEKLAQAMGHKKEAKEGKEGKESKKPETK